MERKKGYFVHQNLGLVDRLIRFAIGFFLLGVPYITLSQPGAVAQWWYSVGMLISVYPLLTALLGTDPLFKAFGVKTCDTSNRNQCGSLPYQVDAFIGRNPIPDDDTEHELMHSHHAKHV